jgi:3-oxoacyl-[acyl-carrier-protein] synthase III
VTSRPHAAIAGLGSSLPDRVVTNDELATMVDTDDEWIRDRTGIASRRFVAGGQATSDLAAEAATRALAAAGVAPDQVDLLIVATCTPDRPLPSAAVFVQAKLGISAPAFDLNAACAGFGYALSIGSAMIESGAAETVLIAGAEVLSRKLNMTDRTTCVLFGDGAGAAVLQPSPEPGVIASVLAADGTAAGLLTIPAGGTERPATQEDVAQGADKIHMESGREVYRRAVTAMTDACRGLLDKAGVRAEDVALLVPHQANARIMRTVADRLGFDAERTVSDIESVGNTSAASIPIALDRAWRAGRVHRGDLVLMTSFGAGLTWAANLVRWTAPGEPR